MHTCTYACESEYAVHEHCILSLYNKNSIKLKGSVFVVYSM